MYNRNTLNYTNNASSQSAQKTYVRLLAASYNGRLVHINYSQNVINDFKIRDQQNADRAKLNSVVDRVTQKELVSNQTWFKNSSLASTVANAKAQIWETAAALTQRSELRNGYQYAKSQLNNIKTLGTIGNVAKYGGAATSILSTGLSVYKIKETGNVSVSDIVSIAATGVAIAAFVVTAPVSVTAVAVTGALIGTVQLFGGGYLDDMQLYNSKEGFVNPFK